MRPYTTAGGKDAHVRVESVKQPGVTDIRLWGAYERVAVRRKQARYKASPVVGSARPPPSQSG